MKVRKCTHTHTHTHTSRSFERIPCPIRCTTFVPDLITLRARRLNGNIDSTIIQTYIVAKTKGLNQITLPTWHFLNYYETCRIMFGLERRRLNSWAHFHSANELGLTRMRACRVSLAWICVGSCMPERGNNARPPCMPDSLPHRMTNTKCHIDTVISPDDGHTVARNM